MNDIICRPIGIIHSRFKTVEDAPIQPTGARDSLGRAVLEPDMASGLKDLEGFSHLILIYHFHLCKKEELTVTPFLDTVVRGVFSTRAPSRPNHIGLSVVRLLAVKGNELELSDVDVLDGTPLLDIKPLVPAFDIPPQEKITTGWLRETAAQASTRLSDERFK